MREETEKTIEAVCFGMLLAIIDQVLIKLV
jgi:hypothetical protein